MSDAMSPTVTIYGIKNCDTMKKAVTWLEAHGIEYSFHDYKKAGIDSVRLQNWLKQVSWDTLINKRGTTWRKLADDAKDNVDNDKAIELMMDNPSLIKRPVLDIDGKIHLGFKADHYASLFS